MKRDGKKEGGSWSGHFGPSLSPFRTAWPSGANGSAWGKNANLRLLASYL